MEWSRRRSRSGSCRTCRQTSRLLVWAFGLGLFAVICCLSFPLNTRDTQINAGGGAPAWGAGGVAPSHEELGGEGVHTHQEGVGGGEEKGEANREDLDDVVEAEAEAGGASEEAEETEMFFELKTIGHMQAVSASMRGRRPTDEDQLVTLERLNPSLYFLAVFDGHGGKETAKYLKENAHKEFASALHTSYEDPLEFEEEKIADVCVAIDKKIIEDDVCKQSGSTAAMLFVEKDLISPGSFKLHSVYVGDSRIMVFNFARSPPQVSLSEDHSPRSPAERFRIKSAGGFSLQVGGVWRVGGMLAVSRAFGDKRFKDYNSRSAQEQQVVAVPGQQTLEATSADLLLLACDGLFETLGNDIAEVLRAALEETGGSLVGAARRLMLEAFDRGSNDNISVILAVLRDTEAPLNAQQSFKLGRHDTLTQP